MYRAAAALFLMRSNADRNDHEQMIALVRRTDMWYEYNEGTDHYDVFLDGENVE